MPSLYKLLLLIADSMVIFLSFTTDISVVGAYQLNYTLDIGLLSKTCDLSMTPSFLARVQGSVRVGSTVFATVDLEGVMLETVLPLELRQDAASWPLTAR